MDFRLGGTFTQKVQIQGVGEFSFSGIHEQIVEPVTIVCSANLGFTTTRVSVQFIDQGAQTKVVLTRDGLPNQKYCKIAEGTSEGMDKLHEMLATVRTIGA